MSKSKGKSNLTSETMIRLTIGDILVARQDSYGVDGRGGKLYLEGDTAEFLGFGRDNIGLRVRIQRTQVKYTVTPENWLKDGKPIVWRNLIKG